MNEAAASQTTTLHPSQSKTLIDGYLLPVLEKRVKEARDIDPAYATLWQAVASLLGAGGKRFRSYMTLLTFESFSDKPLTDIIPAAAGQELLHLAMLIHDDIIDRDYIRYGVDNVTATYLKQYDALIKDGADHVHYAQSAAILAGDLLISEAYFLTTQAAVSPEIVTSAQNVVQRAIFGVVGGELLDTEAAFKKMASAHPLVIAEHKTASYSFVAPFLLGATLADASEDERKKLATLGQTLGIAYQIRDDIMGVFGDEAVTGKSSEGDIREGKRTLLIDEFYRHANDEQRKGFDALFGKHDASTEDIATVRSLLTESGAKDAIEATINDYHKTCDELVEALDIDSDHKAAFRQLVTICLQRER